MLELLNQLDGFDSRGEVKVHILLLSCAPRARALLAVSGVVVPYPLPSALPSPLPQVIMATNRIETLDPALLRPGRIDRKIEFPNPSESARVDILKIHSSKMNLMRGINFDKVAEKMTGASGAESKAVCTEAGMFALRERRVHVTQEDFEMAVAKVMKKDTDRDASRVKLFK